MATSVRVVGNDSDATGVNHNIMCSITILVDDLITLLILVATELDIDHWSCT